MTKHIQAWHLTNAAKRLERLMSDVEAHLHPVQKCQLDEAHREVLLVRDELERERIEEREVYDSFSERVEVRD